MFKIKTEEQKLVANKVLKALSVSIFFLGLGMVTYPMFYPLIAISNNLSGFRIGVLMSIPGFVSLLLAPILNSYIGKYGIETAVLTVAFTFGGGYVILGCTAPINNQVLFVTLSVVAFVLIGYSVACNVVSE